MNGIFGKILGFILLAGIAFGLFVVVTIPFEVLKKAEAEDWPARKGVVTLSYASHKRGSGGKTGGTTYYRAEVCGYYKDNGEKFCVARIRYGGFRFGEGKASVLATVARYPAGSEIDVHFSPGDPKETVLEARSSWTEMMTLFALGIAFLVLPLLLWAFRKKIEPARYADV